MEQVEVEVVMVEVEQVEIEEVRVEVDVGWSSKVWRRSGCMWRLSR